MTNVWPRLLKRPVSARHKPRMSAPPQTVCDEGAWEVAVDAIRDLDIDAIIRNVLSNPDKNFAG